MWGKMNLLSELTLKWYDDSSLMLEDRELVELFLDSLGISRGIAADVFEVLLRAKAKNISMSSKEIRNEVLDLRKQRKQSPDDSSTLRNVQLWIKYFRKIGMLEKVGDRYLFKGNRKPSLVFRENVKPEVIDKTAEYLIRALERLEECYEIKK